MLFLRAVSLNGERVQFFVDRNGETHKVVVPTTVLDDLDRTNHHSLDAVTRSFEKHRELIAARAAAALDAGRRGDGAGAVVLVLADFPDV